MILIFMVLGMTGGCCAILCLDAICSNEWHRYIATRYRAGAGHLYFGVAAENTRVLHFERKDTVSVPVTIDIRAD